MIIYADLLFVINLVMDFLVLYVCSKVLRLSAKTSRIILGALIGALYSLSGLYINYSEPICAIIISVIMCYSTFGKIKFNTFIKALIMFYSAGFLAGGIISFLYNLSYTYRNTHLFKDGLTPGVFLIFLGVTYVIIGAFIKIISSFSSKKRIWVEIVFSDKKHKHCLLCDSGNLLKDPYSGLPVIILPENKFKNCYGNVSFLEKFENTNIEEVVKYKIRYIPVKTVTGNSLLPGIVPDRIIFIKNDKQAIELKAVVALTNENFDGADYDGIIPYTLTAGL